MTDRKDKKQTAVMPSFEEFPQPTYQDWRLAAEKSLKGVPFEKLVSDTYEGISIKPLYLQEDIQNLPHIKAMPGIAPFVRGNEPLGYLTNPWEVSQEFSQGSPESMNQSIQNDLKRGQGTLHIVLDKPTRHGIDPCESIKEEIGRDGCSLFQLSDLETLLTGVEVRNYPVFIQAGPTSWPMISLFTAYFRKKGLALSQLTGCIGADPLGEWIMEGTLAHSHSQTYESMAIQAKWAATHAPQLQTISIQGSLYHNGGGSAVQELAFALATGVEYIRELLKRNVSIDVAASQIRFHFSIGTQFFMEVAKLRAARLLWSKIVDAFGGTEEAQKMKIHARTSVWTKTIHDPYVNMLRSTVEAFAAVVGGAGSLHVSAFDEAIRKADDFSRRISRNTQLILDKEVHLSKVVDPAGGSWYIETLTDQLAEKVWELLQEVEGQGGMSQAIIHGFPQDSVAKVAAKRAGNMGSRKEKWVGTNMYPHLQEPDLDPKLDPLLSLQQKRIECAKQLAAKLNLENLTVGSETFLDLAAEAIAAGATIGQISKLTSEEASDLPHVKPIHLHRAAEPFEALRKASRLYKEKTGSFPEVYLANLGSLAQHKARADFSTGFFAAGGFESIMSQGSLTAKEAAESALNSGASTVVICSTDDLYVDLVPPLAKQLKAMNPEVTVLLAGNPPADQREIYLQAGVDDFIHMRTHCFDLLYHLQQKKGITL